MKRFGYLAFVMLVACSGEKKLPDIAPRSMPRGRVVPPPAESASTSTAPGAPSPPRPPPPAPKRGAFTSFAFAASSGKADMIGNADGALAPDGVKDLVFDAELEGGVPLVALMVVSTDADGKPNGKFNADSLVGTQLPPSENGAEIKPGMLTGGVAIYENDKLMNAKDGSLAPLPAGPHKLVVHISSKDAPKGPYKAYAVFDDRTLVASPIATPSK